MSSRQQQRAITQQTAAEINARATQSIPQHTARQYFQSMGFRFSSRRPSKSTLVLQKNEKKHLLWTKKQRKGSLEEWKKVVWSDESRFLLHHANDRMRIRLKQHEFIDPYCKMTTRQALGGGFNLWRMFPL